MNNIHTTVMMGKQITRSGDPLMPITIDKLYRILTQPDADMKAQVERLRTLMHLSPEAYRDEKKKLPYIVCASFQPMIRLSKNFAATELFILDVDHLESRQLEPAALKNQLKADPRIVMMFLSPGGNGLKILFRLQSTCDDAGLYSLFYKAFARRFSSDHQLEQVIDQRTSDVTRACFLSFDPQAWFNPEAKPVNMTDYLPLGNEPEMEALTLELQTTTVNDQPNTLPATSAQPEKEVLNQIRQTLNPGGFKTPRPEVHVPEELHTILPALSEQIATKGIVLTYAQSIQYGKKLRFTLGLSWAEINLFYGKNGFSVVKTTKTGSHAELAEVVQQLVRETLFNMGCYVK